MNTIESEWQRMCGDSTAFTDMDRQIFFAGAAAMYGLVMQVGTLPPGSSGAVFKSIEQELDRFELETSNDHIQAS